MARKEESYSMEHYWLWLCSQLFSDPGLLHRLLQRFGDPRAIFAASAKLLQEGFPGSSCEIPKLCASREGWDFDREAERLARLDISFASMEAPEYPTHLRTIPDRPGGIFWRGRLPSEQAPAVAIVGARDCSAYGQNLALLFGEGLARQGVQIISGMARGVDGYSHRGALRVQGSTFAVLAGGVDLCYPESNRDLYMKLEKDGGIISECPPGIRPLARYFPMRNRIISGLSDAVLVLEARKKSGSLLTADYALEQGREVFAAPGPLGEALSEGCHNLIRQGAGLAISPEQVMEDLSVLPLSEGWNIKNIRKNKILLESSENLVYSCLSLRAQNLENICHSCGLPSFEVLRILAGLELKGCVRETSRHYYSRIP